MVPSIIQINQDAQCVFSANVTHIHFLLQNEYEFNNNKVIIAFSRFLESGFAEVKMQRRDAHLESLIQKIIENSSRITFANKELIVKKITFSL